MRTITECLLIFVLAVLVACGGGGGSTSNSESSTEYTLTIAPATGSGKGAVTSMPAGIDCGDDCNQAYTSGAEVNLVAIPDAYSEFTGWGGDSDCTDGSVTLNNSITCIPEFNIPATPMEFYVAFPVNIDNTRTPELRLDITGSAGTIVTVTNSLLEINLNSEINSTGKLSFLIPASAMLSDANTVEAKGIKVSGSDKITVQVNNFLAEGRNNQEITSSADSYLASDTSSLGLEYRVVSWAGNYNGSQFAIVATEDATDVTIKYSANAIGNAAGSIAQITLNAGDVYHNQASDNNGDLTGTVITATQPVVVLSGHRYANVPNNETLNPSFMVEELPAINYLDTDYIVIPLRSRGSSMVRILAVYDSTAVMAGNININISANEYLDIEISDPLVISASNSVMVIQYSPGETSDNIIGTSVFSMMMTGINRLHSSYQFVAENRNIQETVINIVTRVNDISQITINGESVDDSAFIQIDTTDYYYAQLPVNKGSVTRLLDAGSGFLVNMYGYAGDGATQNNGFGLPVASLDPKERGVP